MGSDVYSIRWSPTDDSLWGLFLLARQLQVTRAGMFFYLSQACLLFPAFFRKQELLIYTASHILRKFRLKPITVLLSLSVLSAIISALLDGLLAIAVLVPILLKTTKMMKLSPVPFLISILLSVNIGGAATLMGNLPNRMIGAAENISAGKMLIKLGPLVIILLAIVYIVIWLIYGKKMIVAESYKRELLTLQPASYLATDRGFLAGSCLIAGLTLMALLLQGVLGWNASYIAACGAVALIALNSQRTSPTVETKRLSFRMAKLERNTIAIFLWIIYHNRWFNVCWDYRIYCSQRFRNQSRKHPLLVFTSVMAYWIWLCHDGLYSLYSCHDSSRRTYG